MALHNPVQIGDATLYCGDCLEILPTLGKVDAVVTDPPYGIGAHEGVGGNNRAEVRKYDGRAWDNSTADAAVKLSRDIAKEAIIFGGNYYHLPPSSCWLVWDKHGTGNFASCELAWTNLTKPVQKIDHMWMGYWRKGNEPRGFHPTQKPIGVMEWCLGQVPTAKIILDPFMGSGTTGVACAKLGRKFIGIELEPKYFDIACKRIEEAYSQPDMFIEPPQRRETQLPLDGMNGAHR